MGQESEDPPWTVFAPPARTPMEDLPGEVDYRGVGGVRPRPGSGLTFYSN